MDFADAVNAEIKDLFAAGADIVQVDEPWMQQYPDEARAFGLDALNRALAGVGGTVAVHLCFGYAAVVHDKPSGYSFLAELENSTAQQISIEAAQPRLDLAVLRKLPSKTIILGVIDLVRHGRRNARHRGRPHPRSACPCAAGAARGRAGLRHEIPAPRGRIR